MHVLPPWRVPLPAFRWLLVVPALALLLAAGIGWQRHEEARAGEEARVTRFVLQDAAVRAWLGDDASARITLSQPHPRGAPLRYWVTAEGGRRSVQAVVAADRRVEPAPLTLVCMERDPPQHRPPLRCR